jgi:flagellin
MTRIMTNISAINGQRNLEKTGLRMGKTLEKLASGYRINRAADDAAGLAISEKMRAQIRGNTQALRNSQDGISMLQTAEGAMDEVHTILQRMRELAVQAANGTYADNGPERTSIGEEIVQLRSEIDRIAVSTEFNGQKLLTGNLSNTLAGTSAANLVLNDVLAQSVGGVSGSDLVPTDAVRALVTIPGGGITLPATLPPGTYNFNMNGGAIELRQGTTVLATASAANFNLGVALPTGNTGSLTFSNGMAIQFANASGANYSFADIQTDLATTSNDTLVVDGAAVTAVQAANATPQTYTITSGAAGSLTMTGTDGSTQTLNGLTSLIANESRTLNFDQLGVQVTVAAGPGGMAIANLVTALTTAGNASIVVNPSGPQSTLQVGANVPDTLTLSFVNIMSDQLGSAAFKLGGPTGLVSTLGNQVVKSITDAHNLMSALDGAIQTMNSTRGTLGAAQNRLEHTINSLGVSVENLSAAESRIRDADIAALSSDLVSAQILQSAGVSVLSQANQTPQAILKLLQ